MVARRYGELGRSLIVLHGGPGAPGSLGGLAAGLADAVRVLEPFQGGSGTEPLWSRFVLPTYLG